MTPHERHQDIDRHEAIDYSRLAAHIAWVLTVIAVIAFMIWMATAPVKATAFDADGVRCYSRALAVNCLKTANP
jgi:hypothetical protein